MQQSSNQIKPKSYTKPLKKVMKLKKTNHTSNQYPIFIIISILLFFLLYMKNVLELLRNFFDKIIFSKNIILKYFGKTRILCHICVPRGGGIKLHFI